MNKSDLKKLKNQIKLRPYQNNTDTFYNLLFNKTTDNQYDTLTIIPDKAESAMEK